MKSYNMWSFVTSFLPLNIMFSRFIHVVARISTSFFFSWLDDIPSCGNTTFCLTFHQLMSIWVISTFWLTCALRYRCWMIKIGLKIRSTTTLEDSLRMFPEDRMQNLQINSFYMPGPMLPAGPTHKNGTQFLPSGRKSIQKDWDWERERFFL